MQEGPVQKTPALCSMRSDLFWHILYLSLIMYLSPMMFKVSGEHYEASAAACDVLQ